MASAVDAPPSGELLWVEDSLHLSFQPAMLADVGTVEAVIAVIGCNAAVELLDFMPICLEYLFVLQARKVANPVDQVRL